MKICLLSAYFTPMEIGGAEKAARRLAENLAECGWEVVVLTAWSHDETITLPTGIKVCRISTGAACFKQGREHLSPPLRWLWRLQNCWNITVYRKTRRILEQEKPQLVNVHNYASLSPAVFAAARALGLPVVFTAHDYFPLCRHYSFEKNGRPCRGHCLACRLWSRWNRRYLCRASAVYLSEYSRSRYRCCFQAVAEEVLPNPVDLSSEQITGISREKDSRRRRYPTLPITWLFLGRLSELKGIRAVMRSWERMRVPGIRLWIAGDGPLAAEVKTWANRRPEVEYLGVISAKKKHDVLIAADGLLLPTRSTDVSPLVVPEAIGYGIPILGWNAGGLPDLIRPGVTGWLCDSSDEEAFSRCIAEISRDPVRIRSMSTDCFAAARKQTYEHYLPRIMEYYEKIVESQ